MVSCLVTLIDLWMGRAGLSASAELLLTAAVVLCCKCGLYERISHGWSFHTEWLKWQTFTQPMWHPSLHRCESLVESWRASGQKKYHFTCKLFEPLYFSVYSVDCKVRGPSLSAEEYPGPDHLIVCGIGFTSVWPALLDLDEKTKL